jgi:hypothetical protein
MPADATIRGKAEREGGRGRAEGGRMKDEG